MPERIPPSAAAALYSHLPSAARAPVQQRRTPQSVADALYPALAPKPQPPAPKPKISPEEAAHFWRNVDESWARSIGLVKVRR
jgi:hypothetical protein